MSRAALSREARALELATDAFALGGTAGLRLCSRLDMARSAGVRLYLRRLRERRAALGENARNAVYRRIWEHAAEAVGAQLDELAEGILELRRGPAVTRVWQQLVGLDDPVTLRVALDKALVSARLAERGVPVPDHVEFDFGDVGPALRFLAEAGAPCVLKPAAGTGGGYGTTAGIDSPERLLRARMRAGRPGSRLLLERQADGAVHRLLFLDGELLDVLRHEPPSVLGDGQTSVERLIARENARRVRAGGSEGLGELGVCLDTVFTLERQRLRLASVPARGRTIAIQTVTNNNRVEDTVTVRTPLSPALVAVARAAAEAIGLRLAGVDVITSDASLPLEATGGVVIEVNGTPGIHHHYRVREQRHATPVAVPILERLLGESLGDTSSSRRHLTVVTGGLTTPR